MKPRVYAFTGAMINVPGYSPPGAGPTGDQPTKGDPVDPSTGILTMRKTDLYLPDVIPLALTRTYNSGDTLARSFGRGMVNPYALFLWSANQYQEVDLILPEGSRIHYVRTSPGNGIGDAAFEHTTSPTAFYRSTILWNGSGWQLTRTDGTVYIFGLNAPLQSIRDRYGNVVTITSPVQSRNSPWAFSSWTRLKPSYRKFVVVPPTFFLRRRPRPSYAKLAVAAPLSAVS